MCTQETTRSFQLFCATLFQTAYLIPPATDGAARILLPPYAKVCSERERWHVSLVIRTHVSGVAPDWDLWRILCGLSYSTAVSLQLDKPLSLSWWDKGLQLRNLKTVGEWFNWSSSRYFFCRLLSQLRWLERNLSTLEHLKIFLRLGNISDHNFHQLKLVVSAATTSAVASLSSSSLSSSSLSSSTKLSESEKNELDSIKNFTPGTARRRRNAKKLAGKKLAKQGSHEVAAVVVADFDLSYFDHLLSLL